MIETKEELNKRKEELLLKIHKGIKALILLLIPLIILLIINSYLNPITFYQKLIMLILSPIIYLIFFYIVEVL